MAETSQTEEADAEADTSTDPASSHDPVSSACFFRAGANESQKTGNKTV